MLNKLRARLAEYIHPEKNNLEFWIMKSIKRDYKNLDIPEFKKKFGIKVLKQKAKVLYENDLLNYLLEKIEIGEINFLTKKVTKTEDFLYSRCVIHVVQTLKENIKKLSTLQIDEDKDN